MITESDKKNLFATFMAHGADARRWAAEQGQANLKDRIAAGTAVGEQADKALTLLLTGMGFALAFGLPALGSNATPLQWTAAGLSLWLAALAVWLLLACIKSTSSPVLHNEPAQLLRTPPYDLNALQAGEMVLVQDRINDQVSINRRRALVLDRVRVAAACSPLVAGLLYGAASNL